jgi:hypothetical protein
VVTPVDGGNNSGEVIYVYICMFDKKKFGAGKEVIVRFLKRKLKSK